MVDAKGKSKSKLPVPVVYSNSLNLNRSKNIKYWSLRIIFFGWISVLGYWLYSYWRQLNSSFTDEGSVWELGDLKKPFLSFDEYLLKNSAEPNPSFPDKYLVHSEVYDEMTKHNDISTIVKDLSFKERCDFYFKTLYDSNKKWSVDPRTDFGFDRDAYITFDLYKEKKIKEYIKNQAEEQKIEQDQVSLPNNFVEELELKHNKLKTKIRNDEQLLHDYIANIRIFNKCYVTANSLMQQQTLEKFMNQQKQDLANVKFNKTKVDLSSISKVSFESCQDIEKRVYPWLTQKLPKFTRWDGTVVQGELPVMCKYVDSPYVTCEEKVPEEIIKSPLIGDKQCFLNYFRKSINGKGIALTINDGHVKMASRLIRLLRSFHNPLPIEIIYYDGLSSESRNQLIKASRNEFIDHKGQKLPVQELWFVDVSPAVESNMISKFGGFGNKILATVFNSFSEFILMDADTVIMESPLYFFNLDKYKQYGAFFYKDRSAAEFRGKDDLILYRKLMPSTYDTVFFGIPQVTSYTLNREFFKGLSHYMESGLVLINRDMHFVNSLIMAQLNSARPTHDRLYGDKEMFWLAHAIGGDESYYFNKHFSAAIGELTPIEERVTKEKKTFVSQELCSNHPAHISDADNHTLLWFNSGFQFCGQSDKVNFEQEFNNKFRYTKITTLDSFKAFFTDKLQIKQAIIPPIYWESGLEAPNDDKEPTKAWHNVRQYCNGYTWCATSSIGGSFSDKNGEIKNTLQTGIQVEYSMEEQDKFNYYGDIWMSEFDFRSEDQIKIDAEEAEKKRKEKEEEEQKKKQMEKQKN